jgi:hypothetical protein
MRYTSSFLQHLSVLIRGMGRVGEPTDIELLDDIKRHEAKFLDLSEEPRHAAQVKRALGWIDAAKRKILERADSN